MSEPNVDYAQKFAERDREALKACSIAADMLKSIGFTLTSTSRRSESCYYTLPGYGGAIRVSAHGYGRTETCENIAAGRSVVSKITFGSNQGPVSIEGITQTVMLALGRYFFKKLQYEMEKGMKPSITEENNAKSDVFWREVDAAKTNRMASGIARAEELRGQSLSDDQISSILRREGY